MLCFFAGFFVGIFFDAFTGLIEAVTQFLYFKLDEIKNNRERNSQED